jgi:hypothetical protein
MKTESEKFLPQSILSTLHSINNSLSLLEALTHDLRNRWQSSCTILYDLKNLSTEEANQIETRLEAARQTLTAFSSYVSGRMHSEDFKKFINSTE